MHAPHQNENILKRIIVSWTCSLGRTELEKQNIFQATKGNI